MSKAQFADHFSAHAGAYSVARPRYPAALFAALASASPSRGCAWDCATGSGQAAVALAEHFERVIGSDASAAQLAHAERHPRVDYVVGTAERPSIAPQTVDLITVAQALHWFDIDRFFSGCRRMLRADGVLAYWCYGDAEISPACDAIVRQFFASLDAYWPPETALIEARYSTIDPPFPVESLGEFAMHARWRATEFLAYMSTWSACQRGQRETGANPLGACADELIAAWGPGTRAIHWPLYLTVCRAP